MDDSESSIKTWLKFFMDASIPAGVATEYAISFSDNRMRLDMLADLTRDYLRDLNISVLGDVIAILKHAKAVSQKEYTARKINSDKLSPSPPPSPPQTAASTRASAAAAVPESPASRMVKRLVRQEPAPAPPAAAEQVVRLKRTSEHMDDDYGAGDKQTSVKRKVTPGRVITPQVKPAGSGGSKKTVFDRLGSDSQVSSTTPDMLRFRVTGLTSAAPAQRVTFLSEPPAKGPALSYRGVLRTPGKETAAAAAATAATPPPPRRRADVAVKLAVATSTMASDREPVASARSRIGPSPTATSSGGLRPRKVRVAPAAAKGVLSRLGATSSTASPGSVRSRLGQAAR